MAEGEESSSTPIIAISLLLTSTTEFESKSDGAGNEMKEMFSACADVVVVIVLDSRTKLQPKKVLLLGAESWSNVTSSIGAPFENTIILLSDNRSCEVKKILLET